ncbi:MAG: hypothetical protein ABUT39_01850 [Acidobacteriota bacterium]
MVTKELLKSEIEKVQEQYLGVLYRIIKALEGPSPRLTEADQSSWRAFVAETYGSMAESPIERAPQGSIEMREPIR